MKEDKSIPRGGDAVGGSAADYETGGWRKLKPVLDRDKCIDCLICWIMCPDTAIIVEDGKMVGFDMKHCKGCGICDDVCPDKVKAIKMEEEHS